MKKLKELRKVVRSHYPEQFKKEFQMAIDQGWTLYDGPKWTHGKYNSFRIAFFRKEHQIAVK